MKGNKPFHKIEISGVHFSGVFSKKAKYFKNFFLAPLIDSYIDEICFPYSIAISLYVLPSI